MSGVASAVHTLAPLAANVSQRRSLGLKRKPTTSSRLTGLSSSHKVSKTLLSQSNGSLPAASAEAEQQRIPQVTSLQELKEVNRRALLGGSLGLIRRAPVCVGLTVPKLMAAYKAPWRGARPTNLGLVDPKRRVGKTLGARRPNINGGPLATSKLAKVPTQSLLVDAGISDDPNFEPLILWEAPPDAPEGTPKKVEY